MGGAPSGLEPVRSVEIEKRIVADIDGRRNDLVEGEEGIEAKRYAERTDETEGRGEFSRNG